MPKEKSNWFDLVFQSVGRDFYQSCWQPVADVYASDDRVLVKIDLPGMRMEEIQIEVSDHQLKVSGSRQDHLANSDVTHERLEICYSTFVRTIELCHTVDPKSAHQAMRNGMLIVEINRTGHRSREDN
jgi:HSP20 family protein